MNRNNANRKRFGALDVMIVILVAALLVGVGYRYITMRSSDQKQDALLDDYIVSIKINNIRNSSATNYLEKGTNFYLKESGELFGTLREGVTISDAETYYTLDDGQIVLARNNATGDLYRVDVQASFDVLGKTDADGSLLLGGNRYVAANKQVEIYSKYVSFIVTVTEITKSH